MRNTYYLRQTSAHHTERIKKNVHSHLLKGSNESCICRGAGAPHYVLAQQYNVLFHKLLGVKSRGHRKRRTSKYTNIIAFADLLWSLLNLAGYLMTPVVFILVPAHFINGVLAWLRNRIPETDSESTSSHISGTASPTQFFPASTTPPRLRSRA